MEPALQETERLVTNDIRICLYKTRFFALPFFLKESYVVFICLDLIHFSLSPFLVPAKFIIQLNKFLLKRFGKTL